MMMIGNDYDDDDDVCFDKALGRTLTKTSLISPLVHFFMFLTHITPRTCCVGEGKEYESNFPGQTPLLWSIWKRMA